MAPGVVSDLAFGFMLGKSHAQEGENTDQPAAAPI
jgi:hypothetical protein